MPSKNRYCLNLALDNRMGRVLGDNKVRVVGRNKTPRHVPQTQGIIRWLNLRKMHEGYWKFGNWLPVTNYSHGAVEMCDFMQGHIPQTVVCNLISLGGILQPVKEPTREKSWSQSCLMASGVQQGDAVPAPSEALLFLTWSYGWQIKMQQMASCYRWFGVWFWASYNVLYLSHPFIEVHNGTDLTFFFIKVKCVRSCVQNST